MDLKILAIILLYYSVLGVFFVMGGSYIFAEDYELIGNLSSFDVSNETEPGGLFSTGVSFGRFWLLMAFGVGLPLTTPVWFSIVFMIWQTAFNIFVAGFIISSIWNG